MFTSLENALRLLKCFSSDEPELSLTSLSNKLNLGKSTTHRLLKTLESEGFVLQNPLNHSYSLGVSVLALTNTVTSQMKIIRDANPILRELTRATGESSHLGIIEGNSLIYLQKVECEFPVHLNSHIGKRNPLHCTSCGQILLAYQKEPFTIDLKKYTNKTITDPIVLQEKLNEVKSQGYAVSNEELDEGIWSVAAPVYNPKKEVVAAIDVSGPLKRVNHIKQDIIKKVVEASATLSNAIKLRS
ncbi:IclR family transcriptional regulator [Halalkalibacter krulwichiae]|uniref:Glycerol operon regulatory protein n=1 Tax=Halalkalibacter krulwichiae TaxID=199441 RepID=A0A1X9MED6_9BACI|nr:IclR family transcriptional regulator [Halalkalibacter krulwichiae]ARK29901.1 Transcriptional regulator KdgR [Halalkalibacter krulwichiae]